jgi:hypothetical protein
MHDLFMAFENHTLVYKSGHKPLIMPKETTKKQGESYYGGKDDAGDRTWGQANLTRECKTPHDIIVKYPTLLELFDVDLIYAHKNEFPMTTNEKGEEKRAGLSYFLDTNRACFFAVYQKIGQMGFVNERCQRGIFTNPRNGKMIVGMGTDLGPHPSTGRQYDLSKFMYDYLEIIRDEDTIQYQSVGYMPLGPVKG